MSRQFENGDRVIISQTPVESTDKVYSGQAGTVVAFAHRSGDREVYRVKLDDDEYPHNFYAEDVLPHNELEALRVQLAQAEAEVVRLKEAIKAKERDGAELPVSTVVTAKGRYGISVVTKQATDVWLNIYTSDDGNPVSTIMDDERMTKYLDFDRSAVIRRP